MEAMKDHITEMRQVEQDAKKAKASNAQKLKDEDMDDSIAADDEIAKNSSLTRRKKQSDQDKL